MDAHAWHRRLAQREWAGSPRARARVMVRVRVGAGVRVRVRVEGCSPFSQRSRATKSTTAVSFFGV